MSGSQFSITNAVRNAYIFVGREWRYLVRIAILPMGIDALTTIVILAKGLEMSTFENFNWSLPSNVLTGWYIFALARLLMMGERVNTIPNDSDYRAARRRDMNASILVWLLFYAGLMAFLGYQGWLTRNYMYDPMLPMESQPQMPLSAATISMFALGGAFWCIRYGIAPILMAVGYPVSRYIRRVAGLAVSFRLAGMSLLTVLPVVSLLHIFRTLIVPAEVVNILDPRNIPILVLSVPVQMLITSLLTAAGAFALREIMERPSADERP